MHIDILFVNKNPFLISKSDTIDYINVRRLKNKSKINIAEALQFINQQYKNRGFNITVVYADNEFDFDIIKNSCPKVVFEICAAEEHVQKLKGAFEP